MNIIESEKQTQKNQPQNSPKIIINADDYGYCPERDKGILQLIQNECISSTTVIVNSPHSQKQSVNLLGIIGVKNVSVGLHINLTQFHPVSLYSLSGLSLIVQQNTNIFCGKQHILFHLDRFKDQQIRTFIQQQVHAQIQLFILYFHQRPSHIDGHNHIHIIPEIAEIICQVARLYGIYKVRLPISDQNQIQIEESDNQNLKQFNSLVTKMGKQAKNIYEKYSFISNDCILGLDTMGSKFSIKTIINKINKINKQSVIQLMVHPGYKQQVQFQSFNTCKFSMSEQREFELNVLKQKQLVSKFKIVSYNDLKLMKQQKSVLIYSKLKTGCGNLTTSLRIAKIFQQMNFKTYFLNESGNNQQKQVKRMLLTLDNFSIKLVIGVNLTRTSSVIYKSTQKYNIPYFLIVAGTDANVSFSNPNFYNSISNADTINGVKNAQCLISLSSAMKQKMDSYLKLMKIQKQVIAVQQSSTTQNKNKNVQDHFFSLQKTYSICKPYIIFPTSFRKVKCVHHILQELNTIIQNFKVNVYILGPIYNQQYYQQTVPFLKDVKYLGSLSHQMYISLLKNAYLMINCSESQGMSSSVLEAFEHRIPVIVRQNQGNCQLVKNQVNGYVYENGKNFLEIFQKVYQNYQQIKNNICQNAYQSFMESFNYQKQKNGYESIVKKYFDKLFFELPVEDKFIQILSVKNVHSFSSINNKIFNKFYDENLNQQSKALKYLDNIIENKDQINIVDMGCGLGIFCITFLSQMQRYLKQRNTFIKVNLLFVDVDEACVSSVRPNIRSLQQFLFQTNIKLQNVQILKSSMFTEIKKQQKFDIILSNLPQAPFSNPSSRIDKNGGQDGLFLMRILLQNYQKYLKSNGFLDILYSHIGDPLTFQKIVSQNHSEIAWKSSPQLHTASKQQYDKMQKDFSQKIEQKIKNRQSGASLNGDIFTIPADLRIILPLI